MSNQSSFYQEVGLPPSLTFANLADNPFQDNVTGTGIFGSTSPIFFNQNVTTPPTNVGVVRAQLQVNYSGGDPNTSKPALWGFTYVGGANVADSYYGGLLNIHNYSNFGYNVGGYLQGWKYGNGATWAAVTEARDLSGVANPTNGLCAIEADIVANGTDNNNTRIGIELVGMKQDPAGAVCEIGYAFRSVPVFGDATQCLFKNGYYAGGNYVDCLNLSDASATHAGLWFNDGMKLRFDHAGVNYAWLSGTNTLGWAINNTQKAWLTADGLGIGAAPASTVNLQVSDAADAQLRLVTTGTGAVDARLFSNDGTATATFGTVSAHDVVFWRGGSEKARVTANGVTVLAGTAVPAGGATSQGISMSSTPNFGIYFGSGVPTLSAGKGSLYLRTDGSSTSTRMYVNTNGTTGWTAVTTAT